MKLINGDCLEQLKGLEDNSVDSIVTDPPYGISFMSKEWDKGVPPVTIFNEMLRVLKPGGHMLCACGTRTQHKMATNIENAGFEIRDVITWLYGSGFPKSHNISKAINKKEGKIREKEKCGTLGSSKSFADDKWTQENAGFRYVDTPISNEAKQWDGWGTALKPASEFWTLARKPLSEKSITENVLKWGTGGLNIDGGRVKLKDGEKTHGSGARQISNSNTAYGNMKNKRIGVPNIESTQGRFPANLILSHASECEDDQCVIWCPVHMIDEDSEHASRFFKRFKYHDKASKKDRNEGCEGLPKKRGGSMSGRETRLDRPTNHPVRENHHPTCKPTNLMAYLSRLITPPGGTVLDPFMGSGSTGVACNREGFEFIGIELNEEYFEIARKRIE